MLFVVLWWVAWKKGAVGLIRAGIRVWRAGGGDRCGGSLNRHVTIQFESACILLQWLSLAHEYQCLPSALIVASP